MPAVLTDTILETQPEENGTAEETFHDWKVKIRIVKTETYLYCREQ